MPSVILGRNSGGQLLISGNPYSGTGSYTGKFPIGGIQFFADRNNSGAVYIGLSGGLTVTSGAFIASGGPASGMLDGMQVAPGGGYFIPRIGDGASGSFSIYADCDAACSGQARVYFEVF